MAELTVEQSAILAQPLDIVEGVATSPGRLKTLARGALAGMALTFGAIAMDAEPVSAEPCMILEGGTPTWYDPCPTDTTVPQPTTPPTTTAPRPTTPPTTAPRPTTPPTTTAPRPTTPPTTETPTTTLAPTTTTTIETTTTTQATTTTTEATTTTTPETTTILDSTLLNEVEEISDTQENNGLSTGVVAGGLASLALSGVLVLAAKRRNKDKENPQTA